MKSDGVFDEDDDDINAVPLGSRVHTCTNPNIPKSSSTQCNEACQTLRDRKGCKLKANATVSINLKPSNNYRTGRERTVGDNQAACLETCRVELPRAWGQAEVRTCAYNGHEQNNTNDAQVTPRVVKM